MSNSLVSSPLELLFFYYLIDEKCDVSGVLTVNKYLEAGGLLFCGYSLRQVTEVEHDTMAEFGVRKYTHDAKSYPFFQDVHGHVHDTRA